MCEHAETFHANKSHESAILVFDTNFAVFKIEICDTFSKVSNVICAKARPCAPLFL